MFDTYVPIRFARYSITAHLLVIMPLEFADVLHDMDRDYPMSSGSIIDPIDMVVHPMTWREHASVRFIFKHV